MLALATEANRLCHWHSQASPSWYDTSGAVGGIPIDEAEWISDHKAASIWQTHVED